LIKATRLASSGVLLFVATSGMADMTYKATCRRCVAWNDESLAITWRIHGKPVLFTNNAQGKLFEETGPFF
jgi:dTDP-4-dehydrorhamnose 3,5-epimerase-like enzyme